ncbi:MAG: NAD(P)-dependent oxidoreductase [Gammaproteobacteria bacterium]|jgi:D-3-phosphoglycerate dehydrogenase|nr:NAD(P)-dependent oxidoreductase [Gammaproteobacteria bacterium]MDP7455242.1 NAD(P)-dependent oxidoreductase [Gammaproteobacteria bacterium]|tara:strand:- start:2258 stop:3196 length:939 start_codon:yes stop_codon:yes gene_type:complete
MAATPSAVFVDCTPDIAPMLSAETRALIPDILIYDTPPADEDELIERLRPHSVAMVYMAFLSRQVLSACPKLKTIVYLSTGLATHIDLETASQLGLRIRNIKGYGDRAVAEHTVALMFAAVRHISKLDRNIRNGVWGLYQGIELQGKTFGVIGLGGIGTEVACLANSLGMRVIGWNRSGIAPEIPCDHYELDEVMSLSDIISIHLTLCEDTYGLFDSRRLSLMKPSAILINTARAQLVDEEALVAALSEGGIIAALDVFHKEPIDPSHPIAQSPNVILSSHTAWYTREAICRLLRKGCEIMRDEIGLLAAEK